MQGIGELFYYWLNLGVLGQFIIDFMVIGGIILLLTLLVSLIFSQHAKQVALHQQHNELLKALQDNIEASRQDVQKLHKRFNLTEIALTQSQQNINNIERSLNNRATSGEQQDEQVTYHFAMKLLKAGKTIDEVIQYCNLSEGEADVLKALYLKQAPSAVRS